MKLGNLATRFVTAGVLVPPLILAINADHAYWLWGVVFVASIVSLREYMNMTLDDGVDRAFGIGLGAVMAIAFYWLEPGGAMHVVAPLAVLGPALFFLFRYRDLSTVILRIGTTAFGVVYAGILLGYVVMLKKHGAPHGYGWVYLVLMIGWFGDTGAYFAGRAFGEKKLYPAISPGKTWAGAIGGLAGSFGAAALANLWFFPELGWVHGAVLTVVGGALGQCGDLVESMLKRARGVKDSGQFLPGHGGMLDRIDAVLFIAPWVFAYYVLIWT